MRKLFFLSLLVFLSACSTAPLIKKKKDLSEIKKEDFIPVKQTSYTHADDILTEAESEHSSVLSEESIQHIYKYDGDVELKGELGDIVKSCYDKKFKLAEALIKQSNKKYLKNPIFWNQVGTCYLLKGERRKALLFFNKALANKGNYAPALNNLGVMYLKELDFSRALIAFKRASRANKLNKTPRFNLANLHLSFGLYNKALESAQSLYQKGKKDIDVLNILGTAYLMKGDYDKSISYFEKIDDNFFEDPQFSLNYSLALFLKGKVKESKALFSKIDKKKSLGDEKYRKYYKKIGAFVGGGK